VKDSLLLLQEPASAKTNIQVLVFVVFEYGQFGKPFTLDKPF